MGRWNDGLRGLRGGCWGDCWPSLAPHFGNKSSGVCLFFPLKGPSAPPLPKTLARAWNRMESSLRHLLSILFLKTKGGNGGSVENMGRHIRQRVQLNVIVRGIVRS